MSVRRTLVGMGMALAVLSSFAEASPPPKVFLQVVDTAIYPGDVEGRYLTIRMSNPNVKIGAFSVGLAIADPSIINFTYFKIDTTLPHWVYFQDCTPLPCRPDSIYEDTSFSYQSQIITSGTLSSQCKVLLGRRESEVVLQVLGEFSTSINPGPALQPQNGAVLFRVPMNIFPIADSVPLNIRQVPITIDPIRTQFSDSTGTILYRVLDTSAQFTNGTVTVPYSMKGDLDFNGHLTGTDVVRILNYAYLGAPPPLPEWTVADVDCDGVVISNDVVRELNKVFLGIPFPCQ